MSVRQPCASNFYAQECTEDGIERFLAGFHAPTEPSRIAAIIVPHAGWMFSGAVAAKAFRCIKEKNKPATFILFGAVHTWGVESNSVYARGSWSTPFGAVDVDEETAAVLLESPGARLVENERAHSREHSLEVQLPFIKYFFPETKIVPIAIVPDNRSALTGRSIAEAASRTGKEIVVVGTTDLTHYGDNYSFAPQGYGPNALKWMKENDARIISLALAMKAEDIVPEAAARRNACGSGAMAATVAAAGTMGAKKGVLVEYTTSYNICREREFRMAVGYAGIAF